MYIVTVDRFGPIFLLSPDAVYSIMSSRLLQTADRKFVYLTSYIISSIYITPQTIRLCADPIDHYDVTVTCSVANITYDLPIIISTVHVLV